MNGLLFPGNEELLEILTSQTASRARFNNEPLELTTRFAGQNFKLAIFQREESESESSVQVIAAASFEDVRKLLR